LAPAAESEAARKAFRLFADELFSVSTEIANLEPEESDLGEVLAKLDARRSTHSLSRS
jgi:hypothetical protein